MAAIASALGKFLQSGYWYIYKRRATGTHKKRRAEDVHL